MSIHCLSRRNDKKTVVKTKLSQFNKKRFSLPDGVVALPISCINVKEIDGFKKEKGQKIEKYFWKWKEVLLDMEKQALKNNPRLYYYHQILMSQPKIFNINQKNDFKHQNRILLKRNTNDIVLSREWMK